MAVLLVLARFGWNTNRKATSVQQDIADMLDRLGGQALQSMADPQEYARLVQEVGDLERDLGGLRQRASLLQGLRWVPGLGTRIGEAITLLDMGDHFARGTRLTLEGYSGVAVALSPDTPPEGMAALESNLKSADPLFTEAQQEFRRVKVLRARLGDATSLGATAQNALERIDQFLPLIEATLL